MSRLRIAMLPDGRRLHLQDGPIDLVIRADGAPAAVAEAYRAAVRAMTGLLDGLCAELPLLRAQAAATSATPQGCALLPSGEKLPARADEGSGGGPGPLAQRFAPPGPGSPGWVPGSSRRGEEPNVSSDETLGRGGPPSERSGTPILQGAVARRMAAAVAPFAAETFVTPMAAVAGAVADAVLDAILRAASLDRAFVNDGGDIALHCAPGRSLTVGLVDRPDRPSLFGQAGVGGRDGVGGVATSGWRGRSFSRGIADGVTVLARTGAQADAAATVVANAVDLPGHPAVRRAPADSVHPDSDLGPRLVTRHVGPLAADDIARALDEGVARAEDLMARGLILGAALQLQGVVRTLGCAVHTVPPPSAVHPEFARHA